MSWHVKLGPRLVQKTKYDMNMGIGRTAKGSYAYGRPPLPPESRELPDWLLESLAVYDECHYQVYM